MFLMNAFLHANLCVTSTAERRALVRRNLDPVYVERAMTVVAQSQIMTL